MALHPVVVLNHSFYKLPDIKIPKLCFICGEPECDYVVKMPPAFRIPFVSFIYHWLKGTTLEINFGCHKQCKDNLDEYFKNFFFIFPVSKDKLAMHLGDTSKVFIDELVKLNNIESVHHLHTAL